MNYSVFPDVLRCNAFGPHAPLGFPRHLHLILVPPAAAAAILLLCGAAVPAAQAAAAEVVIVLSRGRRGRGCFEAGLPRRVLQVD